MAFGRGRRRHSLIRLLCLAACGFVALAGDGARAQNFETAITPLADSVTVRARPDYDPQGVRMGTFVAIARIPVTEIYDDNIYATDTNRKADTVTEIQPQLDIQSQWQRHSFGLSVQGDLAYHASATTEDYQNVTARQKARIDIGPLDYLSEDVYYHKYQESRTSVDDPRGVTPSKIDEKGANLEFHHRTGAITATVRGTIADSTFHDTYRADNTVINNHDRDRTWGTASVELGLDTGGAIRPFIQVNGMKVNYKQPVDDFGLNRDSKGYAINGGIVFPVTALIQGRIFGGYIARLFKDPVLPDVHDIGYGADLVWSPSKTTSVTINALRTTEETTLDQSSAAATSSITVTLDHELAPNLLLRAQGQYERAHYVGITRTDQFWDGRIDLSYLMNRHMRASLGYEYSKRNASNVPATNNFRRNQASVTLQIQF